MTSPIRVMSLFLLRVMVLSLLSMVMVSADDAGDSHLVVLGVDLDLSGDIGDLPDAVDGGQVLVSAAEGVLEVSSDDNQILGVSNSPSCSSRSCRPWLRYPWTGK